jgi:hypothetical protein
VSDAENDLEQEARGRQRMREEEPLAVACDFGVVYSLYLRPAKSGARIILKVTWEETGGPADPDGTRSSTFEVDLKRNRLIAQGRKGHALPADRFPAQWFCDWARRAVGERGID